MLDLFCGKKRDNKRGDIRLFFMIVMALIGLGLFTFQISRAVAETRQADFEKLYIANDLSLALDAIHGLAGNVLYRYMENTSKYSIKIENGRISVSNLTDPEMVDYVSKDYAPTQYSPITGKFNGEKLAIIKTGNKVSVSSNEIGFAKSTCPNIDTSADISRISIAVDAGSAGSGSDASSKETAKKIAGSLGAACESCRILGEGTLQEKKDTAKSSNMVISINIGGSSNEATASAYVNDNPKSEKIGCLIANALLDGEAIKFTEVRKINFDELGKDDPKSIAGHEVGTIIYIGSDPKLSIKAVQDTASRINSAIAEYYKANSAEAGKNDK